MEAGRRSHQRGAAEIGEVTVAVFGYRHPERREGSSIFDFRFRIEIPSFPRPLGERKGEGLPIVQGAITSPSPTGEEE
jgi:hypothetical protein